MTEFAARLAEEAVKTPALAKFHPCYAGYFLCFNREEYYEAHDILEHLWLESEGADWAFYKGLIQFAGGFVHLRLQHLNPDHPVHGARLRPACRLFQLARGNLLQSSPTYHGLDILGVDQTAVEYLSRITESNYRVNPWQPGSGPRILPVREGT
jgi:hypothetical protein